MGTNSNIRNNFPVIQVKRFLVVILFRKMKNELKELQIKSKNYRHSRVIIVNKFKVMRLS